MTLEIATKDSHNGCKGLMNARQGMGVLARSTTQASTTLHLPSQRRRSTSRVTVQDSAGVFPHAPGKNYKKQQVKACENGPQAKQRGKLYKKLVKS